jgi:SAM-dependent methyltransferase
VGGGGGSIGTWLSQQVGPSGHILVTDVDPRWMGTGAGANLEVRRHDILEDALPDGEFDLVHARLVLLHLPERRRALARMVQALKPRGWLILDEFDCRSVSVLTSARPEDAELFERTHRAFQDILEAAGVDLAWARHAYGALCEEGLVDVTSRGYQESWPGGSVGSQLHRANFDQLRDKLVAGGAVTHEELDRVGSLLDDPAFAATSYPGEIKRSGQLVPRQATFARFGGVA